MQVRTHATGFPGRAHIRTRALIVLALAATMLVTAGLVPAQATSEGGDVAEVRAAVVDTYEHKISLLSNLKSETDNGDRKAVYQEGIGELTGLLNGRVQTEEDVEELWTLKDRAHSIYHETVAAAEEVGSTPAEDMAKAKEKANGTVSYKIKLLEDWIEGCDDPEARSIVAEGIADLKALFPRIDDAETADEAYDLKDKAHAIYHSTMDAAEKAKGEEPKDEPKEEEKSEEEKAAEALAKARRSTLSLIDRKAAVLGSKAEAERIPAAVEVYAASGAEVEDLTDDAEAAKTVGALKEIDARVMAIYEKAKAAVAEIHDAYEDPEKETDSVSGYLDRINAYVATTTAAAGETAEESPETYAALVAAEKNVIARAEQVREVAESGSRLRDRWEALDDALRDYRRALVRHYIALGEPMNLGGLQIPG